MARMKSTAQPSPAPKTGRLNAPMECALSKVSSAMQGINVAMAQMKPTAPTSPVLETDLLNAQAECAANTKSTSAMEVTTVTMVRTKPTAGPTNCSIE